MDRFETNFGKWVVKRRWWIVVLTIMTVVFATSGVRFLTMNPDNRVFFSKDNPQLMALEAIENTYNKTNTVMFALAPKDGDVFTRETLTAVEELTEKSWQMPYSNRVNSITNFQHTMAEDDDLIVEDLASNSMSMTEEQLDYVRKIALSEPVLVNSLISSSGDVTGVFINFLLPGESIKEVAEVTEFARSMADDFQKAHPAIELHLTGGIPIDNSFGEAMEVDMSTLIPLMFLTLVVIVGLSLRSFTGTLSTVVIILISMMSGMGLAGWFRITLTSASVNAPTIILTLAVADSVHILATIFQMMRLGKSKHDAIAESLRINLQPVFFTSITTAIGFMTMNFSDAPPFRDFGNIVAMGVFAAFLYSLLLLPALMAILPVRVKVRPGKADTSRLEWIANFVIRRRKPVFIVAIVTMVVMTAGILRIDLQDNWIKYFDESFDIRNATDFADERLTGFNTIEYSLGAVGSGGINDPNYLRKVDEFAEWYGNQPGVVNVNAISETMKRLNKDMHGGNEAYYRIPDDRELAAQYLLLYEMSLPFGLDLNDRINVDKSAARMIVTLRDRTTKELRTMEDRGQEWLKENVPESMYTQGSGLSVVWAHLSERNIRSMLFASMGGLFIISIVMIFALRSFKLGLLSLIPNMAPALMAFGLWGIISGKVGLGLSIVATMTLGIVVDDTVHFMSKYLRARREHSMTPSDAVKYSFSTVGTAMWVTTIALVAGFLILTLSGYRMNSDMGLMAAITITIALVMDFLFLPVLLMKVDKEVIQPANIIEEDKMKRSISKPAKQMIATLMLFLIPFLAWLPGETNADTAEEKGLSIVRESDNRNDGFGDSAAEMRMVLKNRHGQESERTIRIKTLEAEGDGDKSLTIFDNPKDVKGTAFLNYTHKTGDDDQWLFLPALKRVKRISSRNKSGSFMGSEFSYEDFANQEVEKYTYKWIRDEVHDSMDCYVIEYYPVDKKNSGYTKQVVWIDKDEYRIQKVEYFDRKNSHLKTLIITGYNKYLNKYWRPVEMNMVNNQSGKSTRLEFSNYIFGTGLSDRDFTQNSLKRAK